MLNRNRLLLVATLCFGCAQGGFPANGASQRDGRRSGAEMAFVSPDWHTRQQAFTSVSQELESVKEGSPRQMQLQALEIRALAVEAAQIERTPAVSEEYSEYFAALITEVASLHDARAVDVLINPTVLTTGGIAESGLAHLGEAALDRIVTAYASAGSDSDRRFWLAMGIAKMMELGTLRSGESQSNARSFLMQAAKDSDWRVRIEAVRGLAAVHDPKAEAVLDQMAANDPFRRYQFGRAVYLVREEVVEARAREAAKRP